MGLNPGSWIADAASGVASGIATPFSNAWIKTKESQAETHKVDKQTDRDITIASFQADQRFGELQATLAAADRGDRRTAWIRPVGAGLSLFYLGCLILQHSVPRLAKLLWIEWSPLPYPYDYIVGGILLALFGLRPFEKRMNASAVTAAQSGIVQAQAKPSLFSKITTRRADNA